MLAFQLRMVAGGDAIPLEYAALSGLIVHA